MKTLKLACTTLLLGWGLQAQAHNINWALGTVDCGTETMELRFQVDGFDDGNDYYIEYELTDAQGSVFATGTTQVFQGNYNGSAFPVPTGLPGYPVDPAPIIVDLSGISGQFFGTATLYDIMPDGTTTQWGAVRDIQGDAGGGYPGFIYGQPALPLVQECRAPTAYLGDLVWHDLNMDGFKDAGEPGISGCTVSVWPGDRAPDLDAKGNPMPLQSMQTDSYGNYGFALEAGVYQVSFDASACFPGAVFSPTYGVEPGYRDLDSDADESGWTGTVTLADNEENLRVDAGLFDPSIASLGDRVWEDLNADGIQNCEDDSLDGILGNAGDTGPECGSGIEGMLVELYYADTELGGCSATSAGQSTYTDANGFYLFENLLPGAYCVRFMMDSLPDDFCGDLGAPVFTRQGEGTWTGGDSDAAEDGYAGSVSLGGGDVNRTLDAGVVCPARLGNRVWYDIINDLGIQQDGEPGAEGVSVGLYDCATDMMLTSTTTDENGLYDFVVTPGDYYVKFTDPNGSGFSPINVGENGGADSDVDSDCDARGVTACTGMLGSREINNRTDCGLVAPPPAECALSLDRTCRVEPLPPEPMEGSCKGKLQQFTIQWTRDETITVSGVANDAPGGVVSKGDVVTFYGPFDNNDVFVDIAGSALGTQSVFHMSCSDDDFDGPEDCGKIAGDGKGNDSSMINAWTLEGFVDAENRGMSCAPLVSEGEFGQSCSYEPPMTATCETAGKPKSLVFEYTGGGCAESDNGQSADKAECVETGVVAGDIMVEASGDDKFESDIYLVTPSVVKHGDTFEVTWYGDDLKSGSYFRFTDSNGNVEVNSAHTSCSQPLAAGDKFGSMRLVSINGMDGGVDVTYRYEVKNTGDVTLHGVSVMDDTLGMIMDGMTLEEGQTEMREVTTRVTGTTSTMASASGHMEAQMFGTSEACTASDMVTTEAVIPPCSVSVALYKVEDDKLKLEVTNADTRNRLVTLDTVQVRYPSERGFLEKIKLDGDIFKWDDTPNKDQLMSPVLIDGDGWTEEDISKRQLEPGETRKLEIETKEKSSKDGRFEVTLTFAEGCRIDVIVENQQIVIEE